VTSTTTATITTTELTTTQSSNGVDSNTEASATPAQGTGYSAIRYDIYMKLHLVRVQKLTPSLSTTGRQNKKRNETKTKK